MKTAFVFALCVAAVLSAPSAVPEAELILGAATAQSLPALYHEETHDDLGQFHLRYKTANGIVVEERGRLVPTANGDAVLVYEGSYSYIGPDGKTYTTKYSSGIEGGFQASGDHLPKAPEPEPVPELLVQSV